MCCIIPLNTHIFVSPTNSYNIKQLDDIKTRKFKTTQNEKIKNIRNTALKITGVLALTFGSFLLKAGTGNEVVDETEKTIKEHVKFPKLIMSNQQSEKVEIIFTTTEGGKVNFVLAKTNNEVLKKEIEKQFADLTLTKLKANVAHSIVFNFKTL